MAKKVFKFWLFAVFFVGIAMLVYCWSPVIIPIDFGWNSFSPEHFQIGRDYGRIIFPLLFLSALAGLRMFRAIAIAAIVMTALWLIWLELPRL